MANYRIAVITAYNPQEGFSHCITMDNIQVKVEDLNFEAQAYTLACVVTAKEEMEHLIHKQFKQEEFERSNSNQLKSSTNDSSTGC